MTPHHPATDHTVVTAGDTARHCATIGASTDPLLGHAIAVDAPVILTNVSSVSVPTCSVKPVTALQKPAQPLHHKQHPHHQSVVTVGKAHFGASETVLVAGPCAAESEAQLLAVAKHLKSLGVKCLRAGAFKPRTSPYAFQGMGAEGVELLGRIGREFDLAIISEVMAVEQIALMEPHVDCLQVGSRNMQNFDLLKALGKTTRPVLLKRGLAATIDEFLNAAEYIMAHGNPNVILCERGIRSFDAATRNVLDIAAVPLLQSRTHLPVVVDPSHATGVRHLVIPAARAAMAVGAHGIMVEAHPMPEKSVSDADQALSFDDLTQLVGELAHLAVAMQQIQNTH